MAAGPAETGNLLNSIIKVFDQLPDITRQRLSVLATDGEPSYKTIARLTNERIVHIQQFHNKSQLGQVNMNKYEKFGPHYLHYEISTHWRVFEKESHELKFKWNIKLILTPLQRGRGRPQKNSETEKLYRQWRQKKKEYEADSFQKEGTATIYTNKETKKISARAGAHEWMTSIFQRIFPIFNNKCITNNIAESKNSQVKRNGASRKQETDDYADKIFRLSNYTAEHNHLPEINLKGRPLYKFLTRSVIQKQSGYVIKENDRIYFQTMLFD